MDERGQLTSDLTFPTLGVLIIVGILLVEQIQCAQTSTACLGWLYTVVSLWLGFATSIAGAFLTTLAARRLVGRAVELPGP